MKPLRLPVEEVFDSLKQQLLERDEALLVAPPGAGKTTLVPLTLLDQPWLAGDKILMLEPRRIAARSAAYRMASLIAEVPGQTVGYRMRLDSKIGRDTRIEIITEGVLTRMLQQDPSLEGVGLVIFDEFHERNLDSDLALALCLQGRDLFRKHDGARALKILVMSATLDSAPIAHMLNDAPVIRSEGQMYPVEVVYSRPREARENIVERMVATIKQALSDNPGSSLLAFLPGQGEIHRCVEALSQWQLDRGISGVHLRPLFGNLSIEEQQQAIAPLAQSGEQKVVLATNIAETSLTIDGIDVVVDSGLAREPRFDPATGMTGLQTVKISAASSVQRMGRAGRLRPGKCYRLWSEGQQQQLTARKAAEILQADLAPLGLQLLQWGVQDPKELSWLDPPPRGPWQQAMDLLESLGATEASGTTTKLSAYGQAMADLALHPRLAHLLICGAEIGQGTGAALLASLLSERDPLAKMNPDIGQRLDLLDGKSQCPREHQAWLRRTRQLAGQLEARLGSVKRRLSAPLDEADLPGYLLACAYPDRIARRRHSGGYQLANGRSANLADGHYLGNNRWLAVAEVSIQSGGRSDRIHSAAALDQSLFETVLADRLRTETVAEWERTTGRFVAEERRQIGSLVLHRKTLDSMPPAAKSAALTGLLEKEGLGLLNWTPELHQWCARVNLLREFDPAGEWPDVSESTLQDSAADWLAPYLETVNTRGDFKKLDLQKILQSLLPWDKQQALQRLAPTRLKVASGSSIAIDYNETPPVLAVKLQEMFGCEETPTVVGGKLALIVHLLSPAGRPLQITQDLAGFWRSSYHDVKKEMKGRYPKHPWPDDPLQALPTRKTKKHSGG